MNEPGEPPTSPPPPVGKAPRQEGCLWALISPLIFLFLGCAAIGLPLAAVSGLIIGPACLLWDKEMTGEAPEERHRTGWVMLAIGVISALIIYVVRLRTKLASATKSIAAK